MSIEITVCKLRFARGPWTICSAQTLNDIKK